MFCRGLPNRTQETSIQYKESCRETDYNIPFYYDVWEGTCSIIIMLSSSGLEKRYTSMPKNLSSLQSMFEPFLNIPEMKVLFLADNYILSLLIGSSVNLEFLTISAVLQRNCVNLGLQRLLLLLWPKSLVLSSKRCTWLQPHTCKSSTLEVEQLSERKSLVLAHLISLFAACFDFNLHK
ncbi:hypothetical protein PROFUN_14782 [Planoprotostelium fungivorum]|uniref:Uncharacterized protein n=1 Tax=Planoprotostelium fungivorum TaxID=1890364 RepID=A0A2P6MYI7_9EUKA|nr:hypothetical protein PROFUN_14782 [Planoprotostelium fungivorum]